MVREYPDIQVRVIGQADPAAAAAIWYAVAEWAAEEEIHHEGHEGTKREKTDVPIETV